MELFWIGIVVFAIGVLLRIYFRFKYYHEYKTSVRTDRQAEELRATYRPKIFIGLGIEIIGCIISIISVCH